MFLLSAFSTCTLWAVMPLLDASSARHFPFNIWMPVSPMKSPGFELGYVYQIVTIYISASLYISVDGITVSMLMFGCAQIDIIMDKLKQIRNIPVNNKNENVHMIVGQNNEYLEECSKHYQQVIEFAQKLENTYQSHILFQVAGTIGIICMSGFRLLVINKKQVQFYSMINYLVTMIVQLFLFCWCGNELTTRSEKLRNALYQTPWYEQGVKFNTSLWLSMERMERPIVFRLGKYVPILRPTFITILRMSYSYFAVLRRTHSK